MFWIAISSISIVLGSAVALTDATRQRWHARRQRIRAESAIMPITHGDWVFGDAKLAAQLFTTLCRLRRQLQSSERELPAIHTVLVGHDRLVLRLVDPAPEPASAAGGASGNVYLRYWTLDTAEAHDWEHGPAPYPTLTVLGRLDDWTVLVDLAQAPGLVSIDGDPAGAYRLLHTLAFEFASNPWSRPVTVVAVGFDRQLPIPEPGRVRYLPSVPEAISHAHTIVDGPVVLLLAQPPPDGGIQLAPLLADPQRSVAAICLGRTPESRWVIEVRPDGRLDLAALGLLMDPVGPAGQPIAVPPAAPEPVDRSHSIQTLTAPVLTDQARNRRWPATVRVDLLGPLSVVAPREPDEQYRPILTDLVVAAALHPGGLPSTLLPNTVDRSAVVRHLHDWLGTDHSGLPRLREQHGVWRLSPDVRVDWQLFQELVGATGPEHEWARLASALAMLRGGLLAGTTLGPVARQVLSRHAAAVYGLVVRSAARAAELAAGAGDAANVEWALRCGLTLHPRAEELWRLLLRHRQRLDPASVAEAAEEMFTALGADARLERPTRELLARLGVPARRRGQ